MTHRPIEVAQRMIEFMNSTSKLNLKILEVQGRTTMIMMENKVIYKHRYAHISRNKAQALHMKVQHFKNKFINLFSNGIPAF